MFDNKQKRRYTTTERRALARGRVVEEKSPYVLEKRKAAIYVRVSDDGSVESNLSIPSQIELLKEYCERGDIEVYKIYIEPGVTGTNDRRPAFQTMMSDALNVVVPPFQLILVHSLSRFFRGAASFGEYENRLISVGVQIISLTQSFSNDTGGFIGKRVTNVFDEYHSLRTSVDVRRSRIHLAKLGFWPGSLPPLGYKLEDVLDNGRVRKRPIIDDQFAPVIQLIYQLALLGTGEGPPLGIKQITKHLNSNGYRNRNGGRFSLDLVHRVLTNTAYMGEYRFNEVPRKDPFSESLQGTVIIPVPALISPAKFEEVQQLLERRNPIKGGKAISSPLLLSGLAYCSCGCAMTLRTGKGNGGVYRYYHCNRTLRQGKFDCFVPSVPEAILDAVVLGAVREKVMNPYRLSAMLEALERRRAESESHAADTLGGLRASLREIDREIERLTLYRTDIPDLNKVPAIKERVELLARERIQKSDEIVRLEKSDRPLFAVTADKIKTFTGRVETILFGPNRAITKTYLMRLIHRVNVSESQITITGLDFDTERVVSEEGEELPDGEKGGIGSVRGYVRRWCPLPESNRHATRTRHFKCRASTSSAKGATEGSDGRG